MLSTAPSLSWFVPALLILSQHPLARGAPSMRMVNPGKLCSILATPPNFSFYYAIHKKGTPGPQRPVFILPSECPWSSMNMPLSFSPPLTSVPHLTHSRPTNKYSLKQAIVHFKEHLKASVRGVYVSTYAHVGCTSWLQSHTSWVPNTSIFFSA